jgi:hypothetical protein
LLTNLLSIINPKYKTLSPLAIINPKKKKVSPSVSKLFKKLINPNDDALFRGINLGEDFLEVLNKEKFKVFEKEENYVGVSYSSSDFETLDILYFKDVFNRLEKIQVDVFMNSDASNEDLFDLLYNHFFQKHGFASSIKDGFQWVLDSGQKLFLQKVKNDLEQGLLIVFER